MTNFRFSIIRAGKYQAPLVIIGIIALLFSLTACRGKHTHTFAEGFSYDSEYHWQQAICEHKEEKSNLGAHQYGETGDHRCLICGYQAVHLQVKTDAENQKYVRTEPIHEMLQLGFSESEDADAVQWVQAKKNNVERYTISNGEITVTVSAVADNIKHTKEITIPLDDSPIGVEAFFAQNADNTYMLNGVVAGFSTVGNYNEVILADKQTGKLVSVRNMGEGKLLYGGYSLPGVQIGDEVIIPVTLVQEKQSSDSANSAKIFAEYKGGTDYQTAVVSKDNPIKYTDAGVLIDSQADLEAFLSAENREINHYKIIKFKGKMNFVMDSGYENYNFWFSEKQAKLKTDIQIDNITPCFNDPAVSYTTGLSFSELVFGAPHRAAIAYTKPLSAEVEITAVFLGGSKTFSQFLILDQSWVTK